MFPFVPPSTILSKPSVQDFLDFYAKNDNWHELDRQSGNLGYGLIHYSIIRALQLKNVLCIGSRYGFIPAMCALACRDNQRGVVDFVDAGYDMNDSQDVHHWGGVGFWKSEAGRRQFQHFELDRHINLHVMTTLQFAHKYPRKRWDYIYVDGDHSYEGAKLDFELFWPKLNKSGYLIMHDIFESNLGDEQLGTPLVWAELVKQKKHRMIEFPGLCGIGIIQKK